MKGKKKAPKGATNKHKNKQAKSTTTKKECKLLFKSPVVPVSSLYAVRFSLWTDGQMNCEWFPHFPPKALALKFIETGAYHEARDKALADLPKVVGGNVMVVDLAPNRGEA